MSVSDRHGRDGTLPNHELEMPVRWFVDGYRPLIVILMAELAAWIAQERPGIRILTASGFDEARIVASNRAAIADRNDEMASESGPRGESGPATSDQDLPFLPKPYTGATLLERVGELLRNGG